eukprot:gene7398-8647_t
MAKNNNGTQQKMKEHGEIIKNVMETYLSATSPLLSTKDVDPAIYLPGMIMLLHQNNALGLTLNDETCSKLVTRWTAATQAFVKEGGDRLLTGLHLVAETIRVAPYDMMLSNMDSWISLLGGLVPTKRSPTTKPLDARSHSAMVAAVAILVEKASKWNDLRRAITATTALAPLINATTVALADGAYPAAAQIDALVALYAMIGSIGTALKPQMARLESLALPLLYNADASLQEAAIALISRLPLCAGMTTSDLYWDVLVQKIVVQMHSLVDTLYAGIVSDVEARVEHKIVLPSSNKANNLGDEQLLQQLSHLSNVAMPTLPSTSSQHDVISFKTHGFQGLARCLSRLLSTQTQTPIAIPIEAIIKLICRVLNVGFSHILISQSLIDFAYSQLLVATSQIHIQCYDVMSNMLKVFRRSMLPHSKTIASLLLRPLRLASYSNTMIHKQVYITIKDTIDALGSSCCDSLASPLLPIALRDIIPTVPVEKTATVTTTLAAASAGVTNKPTNKKRSITANAVVASNIATNNNANTIGNVDASTILDNSAIERQIAALEALESVLLHTGSQVSANVRGDADRLLLKLVMQGHSLATAKKHTTDFANSSFASWRYRESLFACVVACALRPVASLPPIIPYAIRLLSTGASSDVHPQVRNTCSRGVAIYDEEEEVETKPKQVTMPKTSVNY